MQNHLATAQIISANGGFYFISSSVRRIISGASFLCFALTIVLYTGYARLAVKPPITPISIPKAKASSLYTPRISASSVIIKLIPNPRMSIPIIPSERATVCAVLVAPASSCASAEQVRFCNCLQKEKDAQGVLFFLARIDKKSCRFCCISFYIKDAYDY